MRKASKLSGAERSEIEILLGREYGVREIATTLGRSPSSISEEIRRNRNQFGRYSARVAKHKAYVRRKHARYQHSKIAENTVLQDFITSKLREHWNPDEISGYLRAHRELGLYASKTSIYAWLHSSRGQQYCFYLYTKRYHLKRRSPKTKRQLIPGRVSILNRPGGYRVTWNTIRSSVVSEVVAKPLR